MKVFLALTILFIGSQALTKKELLSQWNEFKTTHNKLYSPMEDRVRFGIFQENLKTIEEHNQRYKEGLESYTMAINQFADLTKKEFVAYLTKYPLQRPNTNGKFVSKSVSAAEVDWRQQGAVTEVKNQGQCGSCWSFSTTGALEGQSAIKNGQLISLSEQNLVDCSSQYGNMGCNGGLMTSAFQYVADNGIMSENDYPYTGTDGSPCQFSPSSSVMSISGYQEVGTSESSLAQAVSSIGPVSVAIDASNLQFYSSGIYTDSSCSASNLNHGVLAVGYGSEGGQDYWIVKNSWAASWGENGYVRMARNSGNMCGIASMASYPVV